MQALRSTRRSDRLSPVMAAAIQSIKDKADKTEADQYQAASRNIPLKYAGNSFKPLGFNAYEKLVGPDRGSIWKRQAITVDGETQDWLVYAGEEDQALIEEIGAHVASHLGMAKRAADPADSVEPMGWTVSESGTKKDDEDLPPQDPEVANAEKDTVDDVEEELIHILVHPNEKKVDVQIEKGDEGEEAGELEEEPEPINQMQQSPTQQVQTQKPSAVSQQTQPATAPGAPGSQQAPNSAGTVQY